MTELAIEQYFENFADGRQSKSAWIERVIAPINTGVIHLQDFELLHSGKIDSIAVHYNCYGSIDKPTLIVLGGISSSCQLHEWWSGLLGRCKPLDLEHFHIIGIDYIANHDSQNPNLISTFDQAKAISYVLDKLKIKDVEAIIGSSYGGMVALAFAHLYPQKLNKLICIAAAHRNTQSSIAQRHIQQQILTLGINTGKTQEAISIARQLGFISYRSKEELDNRFSSKRIIKQQGLGFELVNYLKHQGEKFAFNFDIEKYRSLSQSIDLHKVNPKEIATPALFIAVDSDQLVPADLVEECASSYGGKANYQLINSYYGHDGFLLEPEQLASCITPFLRNPQ